MVSKRLILSAVAGIFGVLLLIGTIQNWNTPSPELRQAQLEVNTAANSLVDTCFSALQNNDGSLAICDSDLKRVQAETCSSYSDADICKDGRVEQYFQARQQSSTANQQATVLTVSDSIDATITPATDLRCFKERFYTWYIDERSYYEGYLYFEQTHNGYCDPTQNANYYGGISSYRMIDVIPVMRWNTEGGYTGTYSEYRLLDDNRIILGEKEIKTYS